MTLHYELARCEIAPVGYVRRPGSLPPKCIDIVGPMILGSMLNALGCGMVIVLGLIFLGRFKEGCSRTSRTVAIVRPYLLKPSPNALLNLNVLQTTILTYSLVLTAGTHFGQVGFYMNFHNQPSSFATPFLEAVIIFICESFLAYRCLHFIQAVAPHRRRVTMVFAVTMGLGIVGAFGCGMATLGIMWSKDNYLQLISTPKNTSLYPTLKTTSLALNCLVDLVLASVMTYECHRAKSDFRSSNKILQSLITVMVSSGVLVLCVQLWAGIVYFVTASSGWSISPVLILGKIYTITFLLSILRPKSVEASATLANLTAAVAGGKIHSAYPADDTLSSVETLQGMMVVPASFGTSPGGSSSGRGCGPGSSSGGARGKGRRGEREGEESGDLEEGGRGRKFSSFGGRSKRWSEATRVNWFTTSSNGGEKDVEDQGTSKKPRKGSRESIVEFSAMFGAAPKLQSKKPYQHQSSSSSSSPTSNPLLLDSSRSSSTSGASSTTSSSRSHNQNQQPPPTSSTYTPWLTPTSYSTESTPYPSPTTDAFLPLPGSSPMSSRTASVFGESSPSPSGDKESKMEEGNTLGLCHAEGKEEEEEVRRRKECQAGPLDPSLLP